MAPSRRHSDRKADASGHAHGYPTSDPPAATPPAAANSDTEDEDEDGDSNSNYSSVSEDSLPPIYAYGYTYHGSGRMIAPNDANEARRQTLQHQLYKLCLDGRLHDARLPIEDLVSSSDEEEDEDEDEEEEEETTDEEQSPVYHILDVGSGNGEWAVEMAQKHPHAAVLGIDLSSALLPKDVPPNLTFEIADAEEPWPSQMYDFIHMRNLVGGGIRDWGRLINEALAHLKPGGSLEFTEIRPRFFDPDPDLLPDSASEGEKPSDSDSALWEYTRLFADACEKQGIDYDPIPTVSERLMSLGAEGIRERVDWLPAKSWGNDPIMRRKGAILAEIFDTGIWLEPYSLMLFGKYGMSEAAGRDLLKRFYSELGDPRMRAVIKLTFITARKPVVTDESE